MSLPSAPSITRRLAVLKKKSSRRECVTKSERPAVRAASSMASHSSVFRAMGFSQMTCFPARSASATMLAWR